MSDMITIDTGSSESISVKFKPYELVYETDPILSEVMPEFDFNSDVDVTELSGRLVKTLETTKGFGLAAPQCGLRYKVFVMGAEGNYKVLFNPTITYKSDATLHMEEGCLSFPFLTLSITRPESIIVTYQDENGDLRQAEYNGLTARIAQHEIDHLNGTTFNKVAKPLALKTALKRREKNTAKYAKRMMSYRKIIDAQSS